MKNVGRHVERLFIPDANKTFPNASVCLDWQKNFEQQQGDTNTNNGARKHWDERDVYSDSVREWN